MANVNGNQIRSASCQLQQALSHAAAELWGLWRAQRVGRGAALLYHCNSCLIAVLLYHCNSCLMAVLFYHCKAVLWQCCCTTATAVLCVVGNCSEKQPSGWFCLDLDWHLLLSIGAHSNRIITTFINNHYHLSSSSRNLTTCFKPGVSKLFYFLPLFHKVSLDCAMLCLDFPPLICISFCNKNLCLESCYRLGIVDMLSFVLIFVIMLIEHIRDIIYYLHWSINVTLILHWIIWQTWIIGICVRHILLYLDFFWSLLYSNG